MSKQLSAWLSDGFIGDQSRLLEVLPASLHTLTVDLLVARAEQEGADEILKRWCLRITALLNGSREGSGKTAGLTFALETVRQSENILLTERGWTLSALSALNHHDAVPPYQEAALEYVAHIVQEAPRLPEFSREVLKPDTIKQIALDVSGIATDTNTNSANRQRALNLLAMLLHTFSTTLRPIIQAGGKGDQGRSIQEVVYGILLDTKSDVVQIKAASRAFARLWLAAGKREAAERFCQTLEGLCASWNGCIDMITRTFQEETRPASTMVAAVLPPIDAGQFASAHDRACLVVKRIQVLEEMVFAMLSATERPVTIPLGSLVSLLLRCFALTSTLKERPAADQTLRPAELEAMSRVHLSACRILVQLSTILASQLASHLSRLLAYMGHTLDSYPPASPMQSSLLATVSILVAQTGMKPQDGHLLARVFRMLLTSTTTLLSQSGQSSVKPDVNGIDSKRKAKRARYEVDQAFAHRPPVKSSDLPLAEQSLHSIERLLAAPSSAFLPGSEINLCLRLLLAFLSHPAFSVSQPPARAQAAEGLDYAFAARPSLRSAVLMAYIAALPLASRDSPGLLERALPILQRATGSSDSGIRHLAAEALGLMDLTLHPRVPPMMTSEAWKRAAGDKVGGAVLPFDEATADDHEGSETETTEESAQIDPTARVTTFTGASTQPTSVAAVASPMLPAPLFKLDANDITMATASNAVLAQDYVTSIPASVSKPTEQASYEYVRPRSDAPIMMDGDEGDDDDDEPMPTIDSRPSSVAPEEDER